MAPPALDEGKLQHILRLKAPWILKNWSELNEIANPPAPKEVVSGEKFPYFGRHYRLKVHLRQDITGPTFSFRHNTFHADIPAGWDFQKRVTHLKPVFQAWYVCHGEARLKERMARYAN